MKNVSSKARLAIASVFTIGATVTGALAASEDFGKGHGVSRGAMLLVKFVEMDVNNDNKISVEELLADRGKRFASIDQNSDGTLTRDEIFAHIEKRRAERHGDESRRASDGKREGDFKGRRHAGRMFKRLDLDGNGEISRDEHDRQITKRFNLADRNDDQFVDADEVAFSAALIAGRGGHHGGRKHRDN